MKYFVGFRVSLRGTSPQHNLQMRDILIDDECMTQEMRDYWKENGIIKQHVRVGSSEDFFVMGRQIESDARVKCMVGYKEHPYCIVMSLQGGEVKDIFDVVERSDIRFTVFVFKSEADKQKHLELSLTPTHDIHLAYQRSFKIKTQ